jgi:hypothetical protein
MVAIIDRERDDDIRVALTSFHVEITNPTPGSVTPSRLSSTVAIRNILSQDIHNCIISIYEYQK